MKRARIAILLASALVPGLLRAQVSDLILKPARRDSITATTSVTAVFTVSKLARDTIQVMPHIEAPKDWTVLLGAAPFELVGTDPQMLMLNFAVPARAQAGTYPIRVWLTSRFDTKGVMDSVMVTVPRRSGIEIVLTDRPGYVVAGNSYEAGFAVRNRGNAPARLKLKTSSTLSALIGRDAEFELAAEEARGIRVKVQSPTGISAASDDVIEVTATVVDDTLTASASGRITVVPEPSRKIDEFLRLPTQVNVRAATATGVSPFEVYGSGRIIDGKSPMLDFMFRGPTGAYSTFGEKDEYRAELSTKSWRVRGGDHVFMLTPLSSSAQPGFGLGADGERGAVSFGAYGQQFRRQPEKGNEAGAFVNYAGLGSLHLGLNALTRAGGLMEGTIGSATASIVNKYYNADGEFAVSGHNGSTGAARSLRMSGRSGFGSFDAGHMYADTAFTGSQRRAEHDYITARTSYWENISLGANASTHHADLSRSTGVKYDDRFNVGGVSATFFNRFSLEVGGASRTTETSLATTRGIQRSVRARGDQPVIFGTLSLEAEVGRSDDGTAGDRVFTDFSVSARRLLKTGSVSAYVGRYSGGAVTKGPSSNLSLGGDLTQRVGANMDVSVIGYAVRQNTGVDLWHTQLDVQAQYRMPDASWVRFRVRAMSGNSVASTSNTVGYIEYGRPLGLPVSRLRTTGRVYGRVVDATSGQGVANALVRLGPQVAITDKSGNVAFGGVPGGEHRLSMSQETSFTDAVFVGDPTLNVDSTRTSPTNFTLAIARSAKISVSVRKFAAVRTAVAGAAASDSLVEAGAVENATLVLIGERDTLYRSTNEAGTATFTDIPPGTWRVLIRGDAPAFHRFDPDRIELTLAPGEAKAIAFRLVPRKREVQVIGDGQELKAAPADPKAGSAAGAVRVIKPNEQRRNEQK